MEDYKHWIKRAKECLKDSDKDGCIHFMLFAIDDMSKKMSRPTPAAPDLATPCSECGYSKSDHADWCTQYAKPVS